MTVKDFVLSQKDQSINEWIFLIEKANMQLHESIILKCADYFNKIIVNESANFINAINTTANYKKN
jgi:hypothetical protein